MKGSVKILDTQLKTGVFGKPVTDSAPPGKHHYLTQILYELTGTGYEPGTDQYPYRFFMRTSERDDDPVK